MALHLQIYPKGKSHFSKHKFSYHVFRCQFLNKCRFPPSSFPNLKIFSQDVRLLVLLSCNSKTTLSTNWEACKNLFLWGWSNVMFLQTNQVLLGFLDAIYHGRFVSPGSSKEWFISPSVRSDTYAYNTAYIYIYVRICICIYIYMYML